jgi:hypothetical protein
MSAARGTMLHAAAAVLRSDNHRAYLHKVSRQFMVAPVRLRDDALGDCCERVRLMLIKKTDQRNFFKTAAHDLTCLVVPIGRRPFIENIVFRVIIYLTQDR